MSTKKSDNLKPFKKGVSGNPGGRPKLPADIREARTLNRVELERRLNHYIHMTLEETVAAQADPTTTRFDHLIMGLIDKGIDYGDPSRLNVILERLVGKVKDEIDLTIHPKPVVIKRRNGEEVVIGTERDRKITDEPTSK